MRTLLQPVLWVWASPASLLGLAYAALTWPLGTRFQVRRGAIECFGGPVAAVLKRLPVSAAAITLGHVILGRTEHDLEQSRDHEHVHVRQYERWGPLFIPAYLLSSLWLVCRGRNAYLENPFEREAFAAVPGEFPLTRESQG